MPSTAKKLGATGTVKLDAKAFEAEFNMALVHETVRAEQAARRRGTHPPRRAARSAVAAPSRGSRRARAAPAPALHVARSGRAAARCSVRSRATTPSRSTARLAGSRCAAPSRFMPTAVPWPSSMPVVFTAPSTKQANELLRGWGKDASTLVLLAESERDAGLSFRNLERVVVLPVQDAGVANIIGAARLLVSEAALPALVARANGTSEEGDN